MTYFSWFEKRRGTSRPIGVKNFNNGHSEVKVGLVGRIFPESSTVKFLENYWAKSSALEGDVRAVLPSGLSKVGKDEELKFWDIFWLDAWSLWKS